MISVRNLSKHYGTHTVLDGVSLQVQRGETVALLGPSGSGKSTLLRCIMGLANFDEGEIEVDGALVRGGQPLEDQLAQVRAIRRRCGMVFQQYHLFPHLTVEQNLVLAPTRAYGREPEKAHALATRYLQAVGLEHKRHEKPARLSGGEQQRVAIARALCTEPAYLLYDEPTSALDPQRAEEIWNIMKSLAAQGQTQLVVTHQRALADHLQCRVVHTGSLNHTSTELLPK